MTPDNLPPLMRAKVRVDDNGCWNWMACTTEDGYGRVSIDGVKRRAYHVTKEMERGGPIAPGLVHDHLCRNRACINPAHIEDVTTGENTRRGKTGHHMKAKAAALTSCKHGHPRTPANLYYRPNGTTQCRECKRERNRRAAA